jgi:outer membrane receptor protein involved in Fe transport
VPGKPFALCLFALAAQPLAARAEDGVPAASTVTVTGKKEAVVRRIDKTVHDVAGAPRAANGSAQDVLQSLPEVAVTADGAISVKGQPQVTVLVDGKPAAMLSGSAEERAVALQTMSGADIASVEVITNPSAAYGANGGAIVNIVLKRNRKPGAHAQVQGSATDQGLWNAGVSGDLTRGLTGVHGNLAFRRDGTLKIRESSVAWTDPSGGAAGRHLQASRVFVRRIVDSAAFGIDHALSESDSIGLSVRRNGRRSHPSFDVLNEVADTMYHRISDGPNEQSDRSASLAYSRRNDGTAFKATVQRSTTDALVDKSYRDVWTIPERATEYSHGATRSARRLDQATIDWSRASEDGPAYRQWGMGLDLQDKVDGIDNVQATVDPVLGLETPDPATTNGYAVRTTLAAAYVTGQFRRGPWEMLLGGRAERMRLRVLPAGGTPQASSWQAFNPSLHLKRALGEGADLTLSYRRSLQMPDPRDLAPFATYVDAQNLSRGNPGLRPQRLSAWEAGVHADGPRLSGGLGAFCRIGRDTVFDGRSVAGGVLITSKQNGGLARSAGMTASADWKPDPALQFGIDGGAYRIMLESPDLPGPVRQHGISGYANARVAYRAGPDEVSLDAHGQSAAIVPLGRTGAVGSVNLGWKHRVNKTLTLTVNANDLFDGSRRTVRADTATFHQAGFDHFVARRVYVGFVQQIE